MYLSEDAIVCLKRIKETCEANNSDRFDPIAFSRKHLQELESRGIVELIDQGIIEYGVFHPEALS